IVEISNNYIQVEDTLALIPTSGFSASWDDVNGILTISGYANMAQWQTALRNVTYENTSDNPTTPSIRTASFYLSDGLSNTNTVSRNIEITAENDPPGVNTISGTPTPLDYTENDPPTEVDDQITVEDPDDTELEGATISIISNFQATEDVLEFVDLGGISKVSFSGGVLTLTGTATIAQYEAALRSVTYENTSDDPSSATRTVRFIVNDGDADSPPFDRDINIIPVNDPPEISGTLTSLAYDEGDGAVLVDGAITVTDPDDTDLEGGLVSISSGFLDSEDVLDFTNQNGITGSWNGTTGELTLTGTATVAEYQAALQSITYENTNTSNPDLTTREISFVLNDGDDDSSPFTRDINISLINDPPVLTGTTTIIAYTEGDGAVQLDNSFGISDEDDTNMESATVVISANYAAEDILAFTPAGSVTGSQTGNTLSLSGSSSIADYVAVLQSITYENTSEDPSELDRTIDITVNDGDDPSNTYTITIEVTATNDPPVIEPPGGGTTFPTDLDYTEGDGAVAILDGTTLSGSDDDDANLTGGTITLGNYVNGEDVLDLPFQASITGSWDAGTGILTLSGTATVAEYVTALEAATYENTSEDPDATTRTATFQVTDGTNNSVAISRDINVIPVNDPPV
ncbi:MAG: hypothetical protein R3330_09280, partial [Saprospiraceae bacterium]|nr:hypothetical protein [Saprospiraceae bacterium]